MVKGLNDVRRNMTLLMNSIANDMAKKIADRINSGEPSLTAKAQRRNGDETTVNAVIKGSAELPKEKESRTDEIVNNAIKNTLGDK